MLNKLCVDTIDHAFEQMLNGFYQVRYAALDYICKFVINIASRVKRQQYIAEIRQNLYFEFTKSSQKQKMYLMFCNQLIPAFSAKMFKPQILGDLMNHLQPIDA